MPTRPPPPAMANHKLAISNGRTNATNLGLRPEAPVEGGAPDSRARAHRCDGHLLVAGLVKLSQGRLEDRLIDAGFARPPAGRCCQRAAAWASETRTTWAFVVAVAFDSADTRPRSSMSSPKLRSMPGPCLETWRTTVSS